MLGLASFSSTLPVKKVATHTVARSGPRPLGSRQIRNQHRKGPRGRRVMGEEGHGKVDIVGRLREFYNTNQLQMQTRGRGSKYPKILRMSSLEAPLDQVSYEQVCSDNKSRVSFKPPRRNFLTRLSQPESPPPASGSNCPPWCGTCWTIRPKTGSTFIGLGQT